ncbi:hypothetical protein ACWC10_28065 [Streptomyces sp. NPDC001595]|uniref:hypothetical protein n=1 Tax=Streptomyces sp. NPDC001532 TaxID=3154520 RepID=UPI003321D4DC
MRGRTERSKGRGCRAGSASAALGAVLTLVLWGAPPASAGGPTSALLVSPQSAEAASLVYSDERYDELNRLLGRPDDGGPVRTPKADLHGTRQISVTWLLHDVDPWRMDQVYPDGASSAVWIHTQSYLPEAPDGYWHRAAQPAALRALLKELGVMGPRSARAGELPASGPADGDSGWSRAVPALGAGLVLGAGGSLLIRRAAARQNAGPPRVEPRQELIDR